MTRLTYAETIARYGDRERARHRRPEGMAPAVTINIGRLSQCEIDRCRRLCPEAKETYWRPVTRADCAKVERPCCYTTCFFNTYVDVNPKSGSIKLNYPDKGPWETRHSCVLDLADRGALSLLGVGRVLGLSRERVRQVVVRILAKLEGKPEFQALREFLEADVWRGR
jgi:hypothetical protein